MSASVIDQRVFAQSGPTDLRFIAPERHITMFIQDRPIQRDGTVYVDTIPGVAWKVLKAEGGFAHLTKLRSFQRVDLRDILTVRLTRIEGAL